VSAIFSLAIAGAKTFKNHDGNILSESEYTKRLAYCMYFGVQGSIDINNIDCYDWVLTPEGESKIAEQAVRNGFYDEDDTISDMIDDIERQYVIPSYTIDKLNGLFD